MEGSLANKEQAEKCRDMAKKFLQQGEHQKAVRFFEKSLRLYPLPGVDTMRDLAKVGGCLAIGSCDFLGSHKCSFLFFSVCGGLFSGLPTCPVLEYDPPCAKSAWSGCA